MKKHQLSRVLRLWPIIPLAAISIALFNNSKSSQTAIDEQILEITRQDSQAIRDKIIQREKLMLDTIQVLPTTPRFMDAWDSQNPLQLFLEINKVNLFLERMGLSEQLTLLDDKKTALVSVSSSKTRLPSELVNNPGEGNSLRVTESGEIFLLSRKNFKGKSKTGQFEIWQSLTPEIMSQRENTQFASIVPPAKKEQNTLNATLLSSPNENGANEWNIAIRRKFVGENTILTFEQNGKIFAGAPIGALTLFPSNSSEVLAAFNDVSAIIAPLEKQKSACTTLGVFLSIFTVVIAVVLLKNADQKLLSNISKDLEDANKRADDAKQKIAVLETDATQLNGSIDALQVQINELKAENTSLDKEYNRLLEDWDDSTKEATEETKKALAEKEELEAKTAELQAVIDTMKSDGGSENSEDLYRSYQTIADLRNQLNQSTMALNESRRKQEESTLKIMELEAEIVSFNQNQNDHNNI